ncbi:MAG: hypothetical protein Q7U97_07255 [Rhodocyclaceae bacterium]|nr:hypothetical protein [Rhodocyclaceae bacterium]
MDMIPFPSIMAATIDWHFVTITEGFPSPFTGDEQTADMPGAARWLAVVTMPKLQRLEARHVEAFLIACNGQAGRFYMANQARQTPLGNPLGTPVVDGADNYGGLLATRGWTPNTAGILLIGDYCAVGDEVKMILADADSDAYGKAQLVFGPNLRNVPADGTAIVTTAPKGVFKLLDDNQAKFAYRKQTGDYQFTCVETWLT